MSFLALFLRLKRHKKAKTLAEYKEEMLVRLARQQFKKLQDLGISIPVR